MTASGRRSAGVVPALRRCASSAMTRRKFLRVPVAGGQTAAPGAGVAGPFSAGGKGVPMTRKWDSSSLKVPVMDGRAGLV
jgi:hypothetical protein